MMVEYCASDAKRCARRAWVGVREGGNIMAVVNVFSAFSGPCGVNGWLLLQRAVSPQQRKSLHQLFDQLMLNILLLLRVQRHAAVSFPKCSLQKVALQK